MARMLMSQWDSLRCELFSKGFLHDYFKEIEKYEDNTAPNFVAELINTFCETGDIAVTKLITLFKQPAMDWEKIEIFICKLTRYSASMCAYRVNNSAKKLEHFSKKRDIEGCNRTLTIVITEFNDTCAKLKEMVELKQKIHHLFNPKKK